MNPATSSSLTRWLWLLGAVAAAFFSGFVWSDWHEGTLTLFPLGFFFALAFQRGLHPAGLIKGQLLVSVFLMCLLVSAQLIDHGLRGAIAQAARGPSGDASAGARAVLLSRGLLLGFIGFAGCVVAMLKGQDRHHAVQQ